MTTLLRVGERSSELDDFIAKVRPRPTVYLAGPVDYARGDHEPVATDWRHGAWRVGLRAEFFCPACRAFGQEDRTIMAQNRAAVRFADYMVAVFDPLLASVGTPIEVQQRILDRGAASLVLVHPGRRGLFVKMWQADGLEVVNSIDEAGAWLLSRL